MTENENKISGPNPLQKDCRGNPMLSLDDTSLSSG